MFLNICASPDRVTLASPVCAALSHSRIYETEKRECIGVRTSQTATEQKLEDE
jgi:hypothetical protein